MKPLNGREQPEQNIINVSISSMKESHNDSKGVFVTVNDGVVKCTLNLTTLPLHLFLR